MSGLCAFWQLLLQRDDRQLSLVRTRGWDGCNIPESRTGELFDIKRGDPEESPLTQEQR